MTDIDISKHIGCFFSDQSASTDDLFTEWGTHAFDTPMVVNTCIVARYTRVDVYRIASILTAMKSMQATRYSTCTSA